MSAPLKLHTVCSATVGALVEASSGAHFGWTGIIGVALLLVGGVALILVDAPRRAFRRLSRKSHTRLEGPGADAAGTDEHDAEGPGPQAL